jgi:predicted enzyme related to lactoylglutathione lyase
MKGQTTYPHPNRPPKKFTAKSLHGRTRLMMLTYRDLHRFQNFSVKVFGWDLIESPEAASGIPAGDPHPGLIGATGPAQYDYEGVTPGHMNLFMHWAPGDTVEKIGPITEVDMEVPLKETIQKIVDHGGKLILDKKLSDLAKPLPDDDTKQSWEVHAVVEDPAGNYLYLWKCPSSRTWSELETEYDKE